MYVREHKPDQFFRACVDIMDDFEDCRTYSAEYFSWIVPKYGEGVFSALQEPEEFLFSLYAETTPDLVPAERKSGWLRGTGALQ